MWIEFKRDRSCRLTPEQEEFQICCEAQGIEWHTDGGTWQLQIPARQTVEDRGT